ncbi:MAG: Crp/Fnr family transcriptional regulator [Gemmatimonadales bacterium]
MTPQRLAEVLAGRPGRHLGARQFLYVSGTAARSVFFVRSGLVKSSMLSPTGQELVLRVYKPGEIVGELCFSTGERREQAVALEPSEVVELPLDELIARLGQDRQAMLDFLAVVCERLADAYDQLRSFSFDLTIERLVRALLKLADQLGEAGPGGLQIGHHIGQGELARMIGARREVVSGLLNRLREEGLVNYVRRGPIKVDTAALRRYLAALASS